MAIYPPFASQEVEQVFDNYPKNVRLKLLTLRTLILDTANEIPALGKIIETLKWGEPSYLPSKPGIGTTIRIDWKTREPNVYAIYFNCRTSLVSSIQAIYGETLQYNGNRSLHFPLETPLPTEVLKDCISMALTYHRLKKSKGLIIN